VSSPTKRLILADYRFADIPRKLITLANGFGFPWLDWRRPGRSKL
jgi:hypothetical protein